MKNAMILSFLLVHQVLSQILMESLCSVFVTGYDAVSENGIFYPKIRDGVRRQRSISKEVPFPCDIKLGRSPKRPDNVNRLRPGDIDVIAGLGDSLVAASGAMEEFAIGTFIEARGVSWCAGGQDTWRRYFTLPNMIKEFNRNLTGYATGTGEFISSKAGLNIAFPVAATEDALHQAKILVRRMKSNPKIDIKRDWKMVTILFGANDICSAQCYKPKAFSPARYAAHLRRALDYLRHALPRTLVNLVPTIDVTVSVRVTHSLMCNVLHPLYCACLHHGERPDIHASMMAQLYQQAAQALVDSGRYDTTRDFTVVFQPFTKLFNAPNADPSKAPFFDSDLITYDCFHFSQRGHALVANLLWNNMLEPVGNKSDSHLPKMLEKVICPSEKTPYIFTNLNSQYFRKTGYQSGVIPR